jgi:hypothetical protein
VLQLVSLQFIASARVAGCLNTHDDARRLCSSFVGFVRRAAEHARMATEVNHAWAMLLVTCPRIPADCSTALHTMRRKQKMMLTTSPHEASLLEAVLV